MIYLKEDGSLDIERINNLPLEEYMDVIGDLTTEQYRYYCSNTPICDGRQQTKGVDFLSYEEVIERGLGVDADVFLNDLREELKRNK